MGGFEIGVFSVTDGSIRELPGYTSDSILLIWPPTSVIYVPNIFFKVHTK